MTPPIATLAVPPATRLSGPAAGAFLDGVVRAAAEHTCRLMAAERWPFRVASAVALAELEILLRLMEDPS